MADVSIECATPLYEAEGPFFEPLPGSFDHRMVRMVAWVAVIVYPIGIWLFCAVLLWRASPAILAGKATPLSRAIGFLHREYDSTTFWWELVHESWRRTRVRMHMRPRASPLISPHSRGSPLLTRAAAPSQMEMLRKFLLVGLFVTLMPGAIMQISVGTIVCATYLVRASARVHVPRPSHPGRPSSRAVRTRACRWSNCKPRRTRARATTIWPSRRPSRC